MTGFPNRLLALLGASALLAVAGCTTNESPVRTVAMVAGAGAEPKPAPDFVASSRPRNLDYIRPEVAPATFRAKRAEEVKATEAAMEQVRARNEAEAAAARRLGATPAPAPPTPANP